MSVFDFRKLNKIARGELKIQEFLWRYEIQFGTLLYVGNFFQISTNFELIKRF
jgi:hypothetical protein